MIMFWGSVGIIYRRRSLRDKIHTCLSNQSSKWWWDQHEGRKRKLWL